MAAASVALPIAIISIAKVLLLVLGSGILLFSKAGSDLRERHCVASRAPIAVILCVAAFALSLAWTVAPLPEALASVGKYGKLLIIPLLISLIRSRQEAVLALLVFMAAQLFLLVCSWMLFFNLPVPWATSPTALTQYAPFSSYLDEGIMTAVVGILLWHFRFRVKSKKIRVAIILLALVAFLNVFYVFSGRSGHVVAIVLLSLAVMWALPPRARISVVLLPFVLLFVVSFISPKVHDRFEAVKNEIQAFSEGSGKGVTDGTSSGIRLNFWHRALQSMGENPVLGAGVGSWSTEFNRIEQLHGTSPQKVPPMGNPHQEYLLWGVQLGAGGLALIVFFLTCLWRDASPMQTDIKRSSRSVVAAVAVACLFNSSLYDALIGDFFCVVLGLLLAFGTHSAPQPAGSPTAR